MMKKIVWVVFQLITVCVVGFSQEKLIGVTMGINSSWFSNKNWDNFITIGEDLFNTEISQENLLSIEAGAKLEYMFNKHIGIKSLLEYTKIGQKTGMDTSMISSKAEYSIDLLQLPVMVKISTNGCSGLFVNGGINLQYLISDYITKVEISDTVSKEKKEPDNRIVFGYIFGFGYGKSIKNGVLEVDLRYGKNITFGVKDQNNQYDTNEFGVNISYGFLF